MQTAGQHFSQFRKHLFWDNEMELPLLYQNENLKLLVFHINVANYIFSFNTEHIFNLSQLRYWRIRTDLYVEDTYKSVRILHVILY